MGHPIPTEYDEVIARLALRYPEKQPTDWLGAIKQAGHQFLPLPRPASTTDPDDEMFIECAVEAQADYLVTGDKGHLLALKEAGGIPIVAVSEFLRQIGVSENPT
jgi:predicted nucleic acid-binding protein